MRWYQSQDNPKISRQIFYQRLHRGYTKEEAIKIEDFVPKKKSPATVRP